MIFCNLPLSPSFVLAGHERSCKHKCHIISYQHYTRIAHHLVWRSYCVMHLQIKSRSHKSLLYLISMIYAHDQPVAVKSARTIDNSQILSQIISQIISLCWFKIFKTLCRTQTSGHLPQKPITESGSLPDAPAPPCWTTGIYAHYVNMIVHCTPMC